MAFSSNQQECMLAIMAYDDSPGGCHTAKALLPAECYDSYYRSFYEEICKFIDKFKKAPGDTHIFDIYSDIVARDNSKHDIYKQVFDSIQMVREDGINRDFVYNQAELYGRFMRAKNGIGETIQYLNECTEENVQKIEATTRSWLKESVQVMDLGINTHEPEQFLDYIHNREDDAYPCVIKELRERHFGPRKKRSLLVVGGFGTGKTWAMQEFGIDACLMGGATVVFVPLEMPQSEAAERFVHRCFGYTRQAGEITATQILKDDNGRMFDIDFEKLKVKSYQDEVAYAEILKKMQNFKRRPRYVIKSFPSGKMSPDMLVAYLDALQGKDGIVPDVVVVDYLGLIEILNPGRKREELGAGFVRMRGDATERNFSLVSGVQLNRAGNKAPTADGNDVSEDITSMFTTDMAVVQNQTKMEKALGISRLTVVKNRGFVDGYEVVISNAFGAGRFGYSSALMGEDHKDLIARYAPEEV